jgi:hypothetical protein
LLAKAARQTRCWASHSSTSRAVDVEAHVGERLEQLTHRRDRLRAAHPGSQHLAGVQVADVAARVGHPLQVRVVEGEHLAVARRVHVGLQVPVAEVDRGPERSQRVLVADVDRRLRTAAVRHRERPRVVEEGMSLRECHHEQQYRRPSPTRGPNAQTRRGRGPGGGSIQALR